MTEGWGAVILIAIILYKLRIPGLLDVYDKNNKRNGR